MKFKKNALKSVFTLSASLLMPTLNAAELLTNDGGVVTDLAAGLQWQDTYEDNNGEVKTGSFNEGVEYCTALNLAGQQDWRIPSQAELLGIVDKSREPHDEPVINKAFENTLTEEAYLSTTHYEDDEETVWTVDYTYGDSTDVALIWSDGYFIRCVRSL